MLRFLKSRWFLVGLGLTMLSLFIVVAGPYFAFAGYQPLATGTAQAIAIAAIAVIWSLSSLFRQLRARRSSDQLVAAVVKQSHAEPQPTPDALQLRERFEEAAATLKQKRRRGHSLYELPWYVIIGAPGSGKTTALLNSGLHFPLEQRTGKGALRGIGGTRNCDWWFTDEAVFLDTAGRYTTQDSDASADGAGWKEFLSLLRKYRRRRPVNGVILTISAQDLLVQTPREREAHVTAARRRLDELNRELRIPLPVYLMVTKGDLVAGFTEYFDDLAQDGRAQVWGVTFPYEQTVSGQAAQAFPAEFDGLITRLNQRVFARIDEERDVARRARIFAFPQQMAALREPLAEFVSDVFASTRFDQRVLLRGVYVTSGTQEGTPIDRLLGALGRRFAVAPQAMVAPQGRGKAYFIERFLKEVLLAESGLAGVNRRLEVQKAAFQLGAYAAIAVVTVLGVIVLSVSYRRNQAYIAEVGAAVAALEPPVVAAASLDRLLPRIDAIGAMVRTATKHEDGAPLSMRWGLYQGRSLGNAALDAYARELNGAVLSSVAARFRQRLIQRISEPEAVFEYLKAYLMLGYPDRLEKPQLALLADYEWAEAFANDPASRESLSRHFHSLLDNKERLRPVPLDERSVEQARSVFSPDLIARMIYGQLKLEYASRNEGGVRLDLLAGADQALTRKSGVSLQKPIPPLYTKAVFEDITNRSADSLVDEYRKNSWVWGQENLDIGATEKLKQDVIALYEQDYIDAWEGILNDVGVVPFPTVAKATEVLAIVSATTSPFRGLLKIVDDHTYLVPPAGAVPAAERSAVDRINDILNRGKEIAGISTARPGDRITAHFAEIHQVVAGEPGASPLDRVLTKIQTVQVQLRSVGPALGQTSPLDALKASGRGDLIQDLQQEARTLPPVVGGLVSEIAGRAERVALTEGGSVLDTLYRTQVLSQCTQLIAGKYPFARESATDVQLADFSDVFGYGGLFDRFFAENMEQLVDVSRPTWVWRSGTGGASVGVSSRMLRQFEAAQRIREMFFPSGSRQVDVPFTVTPDGMHTDLQGAVFELGGPPVRYQFGPDRPVAAKWPGDGPGVAAVIFEYRNQGNQSVGEYKGPWALFRLLDSAVGVTQESSTRFIVTFAKGTHDAKVRIDAGRERNPFGSEELRRFSCSLQ
jgi:type VI secretion system protein ImpL